MNDQKTEIPPSLKVEFEMPTIGSTGSKIQSGYTADGSFPSRFLPTPICYTVGDLKILLSQFPDNLPVQAGFGEASGIRPVWFNIGGVLEHLEFEEVDEEDDLLAQLDDDED